MIEYSGGKFHPWLLFKRQGSVIPFCAMVALPATIFAVCMKAIFHGEEWPMLGLHDEDTIPTGAWASVTSLLGFTLVFRTSQAYSRFWEGTSSLYQMQGEWFDATSSLVAFCKLSGADKSDIFVFQHTLVRLVSMLNAVVLMDLSHSPGESANQRAFELELIDAEGIDRESLMYINEVEAKAEAIFHWIGQLVVEAQNRNIFSMPPPVLSRAFHEYANGMVRYHDAKKIASTPLPFPYMQTLELMLVFHWISTPFLMCMWVKTPLWVGVLTFMQIVFLWSLNAIATELENPFGEDDNDLPAKALQVDMNGKLLMLLQSQSHRTARLSPQAIFEQDEDSEGLRLGSKTNLGAEGLPGLPKKRFGANRRITLGSLHQVLEEESIVIQERVIETMMEETMAMDPYLDEPVSVPVTVMKRFAEHNTNSSLSVSDDQVNVFPTTPDKKKNADAPKPPKDFPTMGRMISGTGILSRIESRRSSLRAQATPELDVSPLVKVCEEIRDALSKHEHRLHGGFDVVHNTPIPPSFMLGNHNLERRAGMSGTPRTAANGSLNGLQNSGPPVTGYTSTNTEKYASITSEIPEYGFMATDNSPGRPRVPSWQAPSSEVDAVRHQRSNLSVNMNVPTLFEEADSNSDKASSLRESRKSNIASIERFETRETCGTI